MVAETINREWEHNLKLGSELIRTIYCCIYVNWMTSVKYWLHVINVSVQESLYSNCHFSWDPIWMQHFTDRSISHIYIYLAINSILFSLKIKEGAWHLRMVSCRALWFVFNPYTHTHTLANWHIDSIVAIKVSESMRDLIPSHLNQEKLLWKLLPPSTGRL